MNSENLNRVADAIEKHEIEGLGYNQSAMAFSTTRVDCSGKGCCTTACIGGWAFAVQHGAIPLDLSKDEFLGEARRYLGLSLNEACDLFSAAPMQEPPTSAMAVAALRHAAKHHKIDWNAAQSEAEAS